MLLKRICAFIVAISIIISLYTVFQRIQVENDYKSAEITLDYNEIDKLANNSEYSTQWWLTKFNNMGAKSAVIVEETFNSLVKAGGIKAEILSEIMKNIDWEKDYDQKIVNDIKNGQIDSFDGLITINNKKLFDIVVEGLKTRYDDDFFTTYLSDEYYYIVLDGNPDDTYYGKIFKALDVYGEGVYENQLLIDSKLFNIGIFYDSEKIDIIKNAGLDVILRPINFDRNSDKLVEAYIYENKKYNIEPRFYIAYGKEVLGYPSNTDKLVEFFNEKNIIPVMIESTFQREHIEQEGLNDLVKDRGYEAVRGFTLWDYIRERYKYYNYSGAEEIENSIYRAITERNIRLIYFKPFLEGDNKYLTDVSEYEKTFESLKSRLTTHNIEIGKTEPMRNFHIGTNRLVIICLGIALFAAFLFNRLFNLKNRSASIIYILAILSSFSPYISRNLSEKVFSFGAAIVFIGLAVYFLVVRSKDIFNSKEELNKKQIIIKSLNILLIMSGISLLGAVFVSATMADVKYMLEMDIFRGVKLTQIAPFIILIIIYIIIFLNKEEKSIAGLTKTIINFLNQNVKIYYVLLVAIVGIAGYIYISRTGHETEIQPSDIEMIFRNFMENVLIARPRTKEFLMAFPAVFGVVFMANKKQSLTTFLFMTVAAIGSSSIINTFCHFRTPIYLSFVRTIISLGFGIFIGIIAIIVLDLLYKLHKIILENIK